MSNITSAGNLSVSSALNVGTNTILGTSGTNTLICNATPTFNNGLNVTGNITQSGSGTLSSGSGSVTLNDDVNITSNKKFTTGTGITTINGLLQVNGFSITNNELLTNIGSIEIGPNSTAAYIDLKTINGNSDYAGRIIVSGGSSSVSGQGTMNIISSNCTISFRNN